ncbi:seizure protein 6 homolog [Carettochelys insculpta]|uniref:seizure protein 6 homolog n=1 Tax=Carettochelys insculpta TaxID=44489 RepID=UPI003EB9B719
MTLRSKESREVRKVRRFPTRAGRNIKAPDPGSPARHAPPGRPREPRAGHAEPAGPSPAPGTACGELLGRLARGAGSPVAEPGAPGAPALGSRVPAAPPPPQQRRENNPRSESRAEPGAGGGAESQCLRCLDSTGGPSASLALFGVALGSLRTPRPRGRGQEPPIVPRRVGNTCCGVRHGAHRRAPPPLLAVAALFSGPGAGFAPQEPNAVEWKAAGGSEAEGDRTVPSSPPTPDELEGEAHFVTTAPPLPLLNHHPLLEEALEEALAKKDYLKQVPFLTWGLGGPGPVLPDVLGQGTQTPPADLPNQHDLAVFSEQDGSPTLPATAPVTTASTTALVGDKAEARDTEGTPEMVKPAVPAELLTTAAGRMAPWAEPRPETSSAAALSEPPITPVPAISHPTLPSLAQPTAATMTSNPPAPTAQLVSLQAPSLALPQAKRPWTGATTSATVSGDDEETTTTTTITTTTVTVVQVPAPCNWNLTGPEGSLESPEPASSPYDSLDCTYTISGYPGYGVEIKVQNISLLEGETVAVETWGGMEPAVLANESFLVRGQVIRSPTNRVSVHFRSPQPASPGTFHFHFQAYLLSCIFPARPAYGDVSVTSLHPGGRARFYCATGYQLQGPAALTCLNATRPFWSAREPVCVAACGGVIRNATVGRIVSPGFPGNYSNNLTCHWLLEAPEGQRLHLHFEKVALAEDDDRLIIRNGNNAEAPPVYDSYEVEYLPIEGLLSTARHFFLELSTDSSGVSTGVALRYEAFEPGHCYEPFVKYGNFTASDASYAVGTTVEFSCDPGYTLEQGSIVIECVDPSDPQWNETEPACRAVCSGELTDSAGVVLSPNWPEAYGKGQDCIWGLHVEEDKRIVLEVHVLRLGKGDVLTFYDGDDLTARILGQYTGTQRRFKLYTSMADVTIQFQSDPGSTVFGYQQGFVIHFFEVPHNDTCPELPEIPNGWKSTSHPELVHGTVVNFHCYPGFELLGTDLLMCHWDLTWSGDLPTCERVTSCKDPGDVEHSRRIVSSTKFPAGSTVLFVCDRGYALTGGSLLTCRDRQAGGPKWSDRLPKCTPEVYEPCHNPGAPENSVQTPQKKLYQAGATLHFSCAAGYVLLGEASLRCVPGHPSQWHSAPPICKAATYDGFYSNRNLDVAKVSPAGNPQPGPNVAIAVFLPVLVVLLLLGGVYLYFSRLKGKPSLQLPLSGSHPYDHILVESAFDNTAYEAGSLSFPGHEGV